MHARVSESETRALRAMPPGEWSFLEIFALFGLPFLALLLVALVGRARDRGGVQALRAARPLAAVLDGSLALVMAGILVGTWMLMLVIRTLGWLSPDAFYFWTILHVTLSLVPKPKSSIASHVPAPVVV